MSVDFKIRRKHWQSEEWPHSDPCEYRPLECARRSPFDALQDLRNKAYERELLQLRGLVNMLLVLVDPEDVRAALRLQNRSINSELLSLVDDSEIPPEIDDDLQEERPW